MSDELTMLTYIGPILFVLGHILIVVGCIVLFLKKKSWATGALLIGGTAKLILALVSIFLVAYMARAHGAEAVVATNAILNIINACFYLVFGIGLLLLGMKHFHFSK